MRVYRYETWRNTYGNPSDCIVKGLPGDVIELLRETEGLEPEKKIAIHEGRQHVEQLVRECSLTEMLSPGATYVTQKQRYGL